IVEKYLWLDKTTLLATYDGNNNLKQRFEYTLGHTPTSFTQNGNRYYIASDHLGSPRAISDASGNIVKAVSYDSYGNVLSDSNPGFAIPFGFAGGLQDSDTGLIRFGFRDYDPSVGRWTARDPIGLSGGSNVYVYVAANPVSLLDLTGLDWVYSQSTGNLSYQPPASQGGGPPAPVASGGYSGNGSGYNNPGMQNVPNVGPIPQGGWDIGVPYNSPNVGPFAIPLSPKSDTDDFGRTDFRIHGDNSCMCGSASEGCII